MFKMYIALIIAFAMASSVQTLRLSLCNSELAAASAENVQLTQNIVHQETNISNLTLQLKGNDDVCEKQLVGRDEIKAIMGKANTKNQSAVIPAEAGIQNKHKSGLRVKPAMTKPITAIAETQEIISYETSVEVIDFINRHLF